MINPQRSPDVTNYESMNKFLTGTLNLIRKKEISLEEAEAISKVSDKIIKNNLTAILERKRIKDETPLDFFISENQLLIGKP